MAEKHRILRKRTLAAFIITLAVSLGTWCILFVAGCGCSSSDEEVKPNSYVHTTQVGYSYEVLGTTGRNKPVDGVRDGGLTTGYPKYGKTLSLTEDEKKAILAENKELTCKRTSTGGYYEWMDENGYLYDGTRTEPVEVKDANGNKRQLYKHSASVGLYGGDVADNEQAIIKRVTLRPRSYGSYYSVTGLYAPAGEVIKIQMTEADMEATGGITIHIGQALYNGQANNIWTARNFNRMPVILNTMNVDKNTAVLEDGVYTAYVGSFLGGPIYIRSEGVTFSATISGGVNYRHFILGSTTEAELEELSKSSAPYFDLEVWDSGVLHSGPKSRAASFSYDDLYKAAILWEKISLVSTNVVNQGIVFIYDPFVAAGAAVAFPGRRSVNCPDGWMTSSLNYNAFVNGGSWGNMHEYHHNFQNYGVGDRGEVTNNGLNLVAYSLFTKISSARQISAYGGAGLSGWNQYTSATWALQRVNNNQINSTNGLAVYATLLHNLGQDAYIKSTKVSGTAYFNKWAENTHQDFSYYADLVSSYGGNHTLAQNDYPMFVPVSSVYQTGRSYMYDTEKRYIETMQPYVIPYGHEFTVDLTPYKVNAAGQYESGSIVVGNGFTYKIKDVSAPNLNGSFEKTEEGIYKFTPNGEMRSGKIYVTLEITTTDGKKEYKGKALNDVDLVLEFQQSHESDKAIIERTVYTFEEGKNYTNAAEAYEKNFEGAIKVETVNNKNFSQNSNTDVWLYGDPKELDNPEHAPYVVNNNQIFVLSGKLYFPEAGKFRIYMRGRVSCALYLSTDGGNNFFKAAHIQEAVSEVPKNSAQFRLNDENTYYDVEVKAEEWVYFKEVLITTRMGNGGTASYIGLGLGEWTTPMFTAQEQWYDKDGNKVPADSPNAVRSETIYYDGNGNIVSAEEASDNSLKAPKSANYATAYRQNYEFQKEFTSEYFYTKKYTYNYQDNLWQNKEQEIIKDQCVYAQGPAGWGGPSNKGTGLEVVVDGDKNSWIHTSGAVSEAKPLVLVIDMKEAKPVNRMSIFSQYRPNGDWKVAKSFVLEGSLDGVNYFKVYEETDRKFTGQNFTVDFDEQTFRYYRLTVTASQDGKHLIISEIEMWRAFEINGGDHISPDNNMLGYKGEWRLEKPNATFGHVYVGKKGSTATFEFEGTRFAILSSKHYGRDFEVYIDGELMDSLALKADDGDIIASYLSQQLSEGKHTVEIKCKGEANIDSIVIFNNK